MYNKQNNYEQHFSLTTVTNQPWMTSHLMFKHPELLCKQTIQIHDLEAQSTNSRKYSKVPTIQYSFFITSRPLRHAWTAFCLAHI